MEAGRPFKPLERRPRVPMYLGWVWAAFNELQTCRPAGMGLGPIPWTAIREYADAYGVEDLGRFERLIRAMDMAYLQDRREKREKG